MIRLKSFTMPRVVQSPMANCTDLPFRLIAREQGMGFAFLEMVSAEALLRNIPGTLELMQTSEADRPLGAQLVGCDPGAMAEAAAKVEAMGFDLLDLNLGCPVPKVTGHGGGSMLLREPQKAGEIFRRVVRAVTRIPVTVKMRLGFSDTTGTEAAAIARLAEDAGVDAVAVHGRTREQGYRGVADYEAIGRVKQAVRIPVIGNGDVTDGASAARLREVSGCDGVMLGRGALGNPWIYRQIEAALAGPSALMRYGTPSAASAASVAGRTMRPSFEERKRVCLRHMELQQRYEPRPVGHLRRVICWYFKDVPGVAEFRDRINRSQTVEEQRALIEAFEPRDLRYQISADI